MPARSPDGTAERERLSDEEFRPLRAWLEYSGLWAIAIAYPLFHGIASGPEALTIEGAGHMGPLTHGALVNDAIAAHIRSAS